MLEGFKEGTVLKTDYETNNFVGAGEDSAYIIIRNIFKLEQRHLREFPFPGIYRQVPISFLFYKQIYSRLRSDFQKGSIDILVINRDHKMIACRVQGKKGDLKMQRESLQKSFLEDSEAVRFAFIKVVDIHKRECKELFKERVNEKSIEEVKNAFRTARVELPN